MAKAGKPDSYLSVKETCELFAISRSTFYRMLGDSSAGLEDVVVRIPPVTGRIRVPLARFEAWLHGEGDAGPGVRAGVAKPRRLCG